MGAHVDIRGAEVWVEDAGDPNGPPVVLLHGALSDAQPLLDVLLPTLGENFRVIAYDRAGHGRSQRRDEPMTYTAMAQEAAEVIDAVVGGPAMLVGWSDGGVTAMHVATAHPGQVSRLVTVGSNFDQAGYLPPRNEEEAGQDMLLDAFLAYEGNTREGFDELVRSSTHLWHSGPNLTVRDMAGITAPYLFLVGDDDTVSLDHAVRAYAAVPQGQLGVVPGASHMLPVERPAMFATLVSEFLAGPEVPETLVPLRRAKR